MKKINRKKVLTAVGLIVLMITSLQSCKKEEESKKDFSDHQVSYIQDKLKSGGVSPKLVLIPTGTAILGDVAGSSPDEARLERLKMALETPTYRVEIEQSFALGVFEVSFDEYDRFCDATKQPKPADEGWGRGTHPVINVTWRSARAYTQWLSKETGKHYFLPSEAQWEYATRAGTTTSYWWGEREGDKLAQCSDCAEQSRCEDCQDRLLVDDGTALVGSYAANPFGLYDVHGNVQEWTRDCSKYRHNSGLSHGEAITEGNCATHVLKSGSWWNNTQFIRSSSRTIARDAGDEGSKHIGFRVAREL